MKYLLKIFIFLYFISTGAIASASTSVPGTIVLASPENMQTQVSFTGTVDWMSDIEANDYQLQISTDLVFTSLVVDTTISDTSYLYLGQLEGSTVYFWRVKGLNICGDGPFSEIRQFTIGKVAETCLEVSYTSDPFPISDNDTITIPLNFSALGVVTSARVVNVDIDHPSIGDVSLHLINPQAKEISLVENICGSDSDMNLGFQDNGSAAIPCPPTSGQFYQPEEPLSLYNDERVKGQWSLWVADQATLNEGWMNSWTLEICFLRAADDCTTMEDLNGSIATGTYHFVDELSSAGSIQSNATVKFKAGNAININPNFKTGNNSVLELIIEECEEDLPQR